MEFDGLSRKVIGSAIEVHRQLGPGLLESVYQRCLAYELSASGLLVEVERAVGEHNAEAPGRALGILFEQVDMRVRMTPFPEIGEIEAAGASADDGDTHVFLPIDSILTN